MLLAVQYSVRCDAMQYTNYVFYHLRKKRLFLKLFVCFYSLFTLAYFCCCCIIIILICIYFYLLLFLMHFQLLVDYRYNAVVVVHVRCHTSCCSSACLRCSLFGSAMLIRFTFILFDIYFYAGAVKLIITCCCCCFMWHRCLTQTRSNE